MKPSNELDELLKIIQFRANLSHEEIAKKIGYSRPHLTKSRKEGGSEKIIGRLKEIFADILQDDTKNDNQIIEDLPAKSIHNLTESNRLLAEANKKLAENAVELTSLVRHSTGDYPEENHLSVESIIGGLQELLIDLGLGKHWKSKNEGEAIVRKHLFSRLPKDKAIGIRSDSGKQSKGT